MSEQRKLGKWSRNRPSRIGLIEIPNTGEHLLKESEKQTVDGSIGFRVSEFEEAKQFAAVPSEESGSTRPVV